MRVRVPDKNEEDEDEEIKEVRDQIGKHLDLTDSARAREILTHWDQFLKQFLKIMPEDYERVLNALKRAEERGLQGDEAIQAAFEENVAAGH